MNMSRTFTESVATIESLIQPTAPIETLLYLKIYTLKERKINDKIKTNNQLNNYYNIIKFTTYYYEKESYNYSNKI